MRQLCNAAYYSLVEWADEKKRVELDRKLVEQPDTRTRAGTQPRVVGHNVDGLMAVMRAGRAPGRRVKAG